MIRKTIVASCDFVIKYSNNVYNSKCRFYKKKIDYSPQVQA